MRLEASDRRKQAYACRRNARGEMATAIGWRSDRGEIRYPFLWNCVRTASMLGAIKRSLLNNIMFIYDYKIEHIKYNLHII